ncbi:hypothetical protein [Parvibaculum sp.]|uniref:hypothetical protein n=1 Tax=Parvibaculum sp. TaxID=2024848 RepID=UPI0038B24011
MIAYARAFALVCEMRNSGPLPHYFNDGIEASLRAAQEDKKNRRTDSASRSNSVRNGSIFFSGILLSFIGLTVSLNDKLDNSVPPARVVHVVRHVYEHLDYAFATLFLLALPFLIRIRVFFDWMKNIFFRNVTRLIQVFPQKVATTILAVVTVGLFLLTWTVTTFLLRAS